MSATSELWGAENLVLNGLLQRMRSDPQGGKTELSEVQAKALSLASGRYVRTSHLVIDEAAMRTLVSLYADEKLNAWRDAIEWFGQALRVVDDWMSDALQWLGQKLVARANLAAQEEFGLVLHMIGQAVRSREFDAAWVRWLPEELSIRTRILVDAHASYHEQARFITATVQTNDLRAVDWLITLMESGCDECARVALARLAEHARGSVGNLAQALTDSRSRSSLQRSLEDFLGHPTADVRLKRLKAAMLGVCRRFGADAEADAAITASQWVDDLEGLGVIDRGDALLRLAL